MADIKTKDAVKGTIKTIDKAAIAGQRMKQAYVQTKEKAEHSTHAQENSAEEYAADRLESGADRLTHEAAYQFDKVQAWNNCTEASKIVRTACSNIKNTEYGHGKTSTDLVRSISTYALQNDSETMAEAFADVYANGDNAKPLSKEIKRLTRLLMNTYKGGNLNANNQ